MMMSSLDNVLAYLSPNRVFDEIDKRIDDAMIRFPVESAVITKWNCFRDLMVRFYCHMENAALRMDPPRNVEPWMDWGRCVRVLTDIYGRNGEKAAFELVRTGKEQGLYGVLRLTARQMAKQYADQEIVAIANSFWNRLSVDEKFEVTDEYLRRFGHLLPPELTEGSAGRIRAEFPQVLRNHPTMMRHLESAARNASQSHDRD